MSFELLGFDIVGEFDKFVAVRRELAAPLVGRRVTVADVFNFATKLQAAYVGAGYLLARVVVAPQELNEKARVKIKVIDGFIERLEVEALPAFVRGRVAAVLQPLVNKRHLLQRELERRLLIASDTPGLDLRTTFAAGNEIGGSVLILAGPYRAITASAYIDNAMPRVYGTTQTVALLGFNSVLGLGEQISVSATGLPVRNFGTDIPDPALCASELCNAAWHRWPEIFRCDHRRPNHTQCYSGGGHAGRFQANECGARLRRVKSRDFQLTVSGRLDLTYERIDTLVLNPPVSLSLDQVRPVRATVDGSWRNRDTDTNIVFGATVSRGLNALGARTLADASLELPLSRQGADAVFTKLNVGLGVLQNLPSSFFVSTTAYAQSSFNRPLLTSEQFDITGPKALSGFTAGALPGDSAWVARTEVGHLIQLPIETGGVNVTRYLFGATGERLFYQPTVLELGSVHATNFGAGMRFSFVRWNNFMPNSYAFVETSPNKHQSAA